MEQEEQELGPAPGSSIAELLICRVCNQLVCEPITLPCGDTSCRTCLVKELRQKARRCPCCGKPCHTRYFVNVGDVQGGTYVDEIPPSTPFKFAAWQRPTRTLRCAWRVEVAATLLLLGFPVSLQPFGTKVGSKRRKKLRMTQDESYLNGLILFRFHSGSFFADRFVTGAGAS